MKLTNNIKRKITLIMTLAFAVVFMFTACKKETESLTVFLTDAPAEYQEVNVEIQQVKIHIKASNDDDAGWYDLETNEGIYELKSLENSSVILAEDEKLPEGELTQIRFILGENNTVVDSSGTSHDMQVPSGEEAGLKIQGHSLDRNEDEEITIDFDAEKSVVKSGSGDFLLKPVLTTVE